MGRSLDTRLLSDYILFLEVCTESDGKLNRGLATRLHFCVSYDLRKKSHRHSCSFACVCTHMCVLCVCACVGGGGPPHHSFNALYVNLNEDVALVRIT